MTELMKLIEDELKKEYPSTDISIGYLEDFYPSVLPAILIVPGTMDKQMVNLNGHTRKVSLSIEYFEQHIPSLSLEEIEACEKLISFIENNTEVQRKVVYINSNLSTDIEKEGDDLNGIFRGKIKINTQLRR